MMTRSCLLITWSPIDFGLSIPIGKSINWKLNFSNRTVVDLLSHVSEALVNWPWIQGLNYIYILRQLGSETNQRWLIVCRVGWYDGWPLWTRCVFFFKGARFQMFWFRYIRHGYFRVSFKTERSHIDKFSDVDDPECGAWIWLLVKKKT